VKQSELTIYWAPYWPAASKYDLNHIYPSPKSLYHYWFEQYTPQRRPDVYFNCPATSRKMKRTFVFNNIVDTKTKFTDDGTIQYERPDKLQMINELIHPPTINNYRLVNIQYSLLVFCEESVIGSMESPFFHKTEMSKYGAIVPGEFDMGKWYRPLNAEIQLWEGCNELHLAANEPIFYLEFLTDRPIILQRYQVTKRLSTIASSLVHVNPLQKFASLSEKYEVFRQSRLSSQILREIRENLVD